MAPQDDGPKTLDYQKPSAAGYFDWFELGRWEGITNIDPTDVSAVLNESAYANADLDFNHIIVTKAAVHLRRRVGPVCSIELRFDRNETSVVIMARRNLPAKLFVVPAMFLFVGFAVIVLALFDNRQSNGPSSFSDLSVAAIIAPCCLLPALLLWIQRQFMHKQDEALLSFVKNAMFGAKMLTALCNTSASQSC